MDVTSTLNRLSVFAHSPVLGTEAILELEALAHCASSSSTLLDENVMCQCAELLEETLPISSIAARALLTYLANACLSDSNKHAAIRYGIPQTCVLYLQRSEEMNDETLYPLLDLVATLSSSSSEGRRSLRPSIPYIVACMFRRHSSLEILFASCSTLSTLALLDSSNGELIVSTGGLQALINAFRFAYDVKRSILQEKGNHLTMKTNQMERLELCEVVLKWSKDAALKAIRCPSDSIDEVIKNIDFGRFGQVIEVDQLMWDIKFERKKCNNKFYSSSISA